MQITDIVQQKGRYTIYLNDEPAFWLYKTEVEACGLHVNDELDDDKADEIITEVIGKRAVLYCLKLLEKRDYTERQIRQKLKDAGYPDRAQERAVAYALSHRYVDDTRYAQNYAERKCASRSAKQIKTELMEKGIDSEVIDRVLDASDLPDETDLIVFWIEKKHYDRETADEASQRRMMQFLMRKGFSYSAIKRVL